MATTNITGPLVWPSQNDLYGSGVSGSANDGKRWFERQLRKLWPSLGGGNNYVLSGGTVPATDPDLVLQVAAGSAVIDGHYCQWPATNITLPASQTSHLFLKLVFSSSLIVDLAIEDNTTGSAPASSTKLCTATTSGSAVTATTDARIVGPGSVVSLSAGTYTVPAGIRRAKLRIWGAGGGGGGGEDSGFVIDGNNGSAGGTTSVGTLVSVNGGGGGGGGGLGGSVGADATVHTGQIGIVGQGSRRGEGGAGGGSATSGLPGGAGIYVEIVVNLTPDGTHTVTLGAGGTGGGNNGGDGQVGSNGEAGRVVIEYL